MYRHKRYESALDELNSHLAPSQFKYLLDSLSEVPANKELGQDGDTESYRSYSRTSSTEKADDFLNYQKYFGSMSTSKHTLRQGNKIHQFLDHPTLNSNIFKGKALLQSKLLYQTISSTDSAVSVKGKHSNHHHRYSMVGSNEEMSSRKALKGGSSSGTDIEENVGQILKKYEELQLEVAMYFHGATVLKPTLEPAKPCSELRVCKRINNKFPNQDIARLSRTSSTETVMAESLPDLDNPLVPIAGRIANEVVTPFPYLKKSQNKLTLKKRTGRNGQAKSNFTDRSRIEKDIDRSLGKLQDYKDVSQFFSKSKIKGKANSTAAGRGSKKICNLRISVTNPLYKVYDPTGYHKSDDELAIECIQMVCNDFNAWMKSLVSPKAKKLNNKEDDSSNSKEEDGYKEEEDEEIGPEFLIQILRTELELPEKN